MEIKINTEGQGLKAISMADATIDTKMIRFMEPTPLNHIVIAYEVFAEGSVVVFGGEDTKLSILVGIIDKNGNRISPLDFALEAVKRIAEKIEEYTRKTF